MDDDLKENLADLISTGLLFVAKAHLWHLTTKTHARHVALGEFYEQLSTLLDRFAESAIGVGIPDLVERIEPQMSVTFSADHSAEDEIREFVDFLAENYEVLQDAEYNPLTNIIDEIQALCLRTIYKLNLK